MGTAEGNPASKFPKISIKMKVLDDFDDEFDAETHRKKGGVLKKDSECTIELLDGEIKRIGKDPNNHVVLNDEEVAPVQFSLSHLNGIVYLNCWSNEYPTGI